MSEVAASKRHSANQLSAAAQHVDDDIKFNDSLLPEWTSHSLHPVISHSLLALSFIKPTPIQKAALPAAREGHDIVGVAETGSGKTLAYALPIIHYILSQSAPSDTKSKRNLSALILAPTRELALQVCEHLKKVVSAGAGSSLGGVPRVSVAAIIGGLSLQKQRRVLERGADVIVATPGRLWDVLGEVGLIFTCVLELYLWCNDRTTALLVRSAIFAVWYSMKQTAWLKLDIFKS